MAREGLAHRSPEASLAVVVFGAMALATTLGCMPPVESSVDASGACKFEAPPASCPTAAPSFGTSGNQGATAINQIIQSSCAVSNCHAPTGTESKVPFQTYAEILSAVQATSFSFVSYISNCRMPPAGYPQLSAGDRTSLLTWITCGAPNN